MIYCSLDFETTGVDTVNDRPIEFGGLLYSTGQRKCLDNLGVLIKTDKVITAEITDITGIHPVAVERYGYDQAEILPLVLDMVSQSDAVIGYNCRRFDKKILYEWASREGMAVPEKPWIDMFYDMPWRVPTAKLSHVLADHGFINYFPHSAYADAQGVVLLSTKYDEQLLLNRAQSKIVILQGQQGRNNNDIVKRPPFRFRWQPTEKIWWKPVKEQDVDEVVQSAPFQIIQTNYTQEELDS